MIPILLGLQVKVSSFKLENGRVVMVSGANQDFDVVVSLDERRHEGINALIVNTSVTATDKNQAYSAGYGEGFMTSHLIEMFYTNYIADEASNHYRKNGSWLPFYVTYATNQLDWISQMVRQNANDDFWHGVDLIVQQLVGMLDGYNAANTTMKLTIVDLFLLNGQMDLADFLYFVDSKARLSQFLHGEFDHCTVLIRLTPDCKDVIFAHNTWGNYYFGFIRMAKTYMFNYKFMKTQHQALAFSGYPGVLDSVDDFYMFRNQNATSTCNIAVTESTIPLINFTLVKNHIRPDGKALLSFIRAPLAGLMSMTLDDWNATYSNHSSFTYNNNYLLFDYQAFEAVQNQCPNCSPDQIKSFIIMNNITLLKSSEIMPAHAFYWDATKTLLDNGFYLSANAPENAEVELLSGCWWVNLLTENLLSYEKGSRLCIARRQMPSLTGVDQIKRFMLYNDYKNDECQLKDPFRGIAARTDLKRLLKSEGGATDVKLTTLEQSKSLQFLFYVGVPVGGPSELPDYNQLKQFDNPPLGAYERLPNVWAVVSGCGDFIQCPDYLQSNENVGLIVGGVVGIAVVAAAIVVVVCVIWRRNARRAALAKSAEVITVEEDIVEEELVGEVINIDQMEKQVLVK